MALKNLKAELLIGILQRGHTFFLLSHSRVHYG